MNLLIHPTLESGTFHIVLQRILPCATLKSVSPFFFFFFLFGFHDPYYYSFLCSLSMRFLFAVQA